MKRSRPKIRQMPETPPDLSFPVPYPEQAKYLKIADDFLGLKEPQQDQSTLISIDSGRAVKLATEANKVA